MNGWKEQAWEYFRDGNYIALGWYHENYTAWAIDRIVEDIKRGQYGNEAEAIDAHTKFFELEVGDVIAVNNVNKGFFGIGVITSDYKYEKYKHPTGHEDRSEHYSHYREVRWLIRDFVWREELTRQNEKYWEPRGTLGVRDTLPGYIRALLSERGIDLAANAVDWIGDSELVGYEGRIREELRLHKWIERDRKFIELVRNKWANIIACMACDLEPFKAFRL